MRSEWKGNMKRKPKKKSKGVGDKAKKQALGVLAARFGGKGAAPPFGKK